MLKEAGCNWVILGHSERRTLFHEDDEVKKSRMNYSHTFFLLSSF
jgi:triosephosphate isomerase